MIDIQKYIESGILEDYVLNNLSEKDRQEVQCLSNIHPEIATEIKSIRESLSIFDEVNAEETPAEMKDKLWDAISDEKQEEETTQVHKLADASRNLNNRSRKYTYAAVAAFAAVSIVSIFWNLYLNSKLDDTQEKITLYENENNALRNSITQLNSDIEQMDQIYSIENSKVVRMKGLENKSPESLAFAIWDKSTKSVYLDIKKLPINPEGKQYQLWTITPEGNPVSVGVFDMLQRNLIFEVGNAETSQKFAVTLEKEGGAKTPTLSEMYIIGDV